MSYIDWTRFMRDVSHNADALAAGNKANVGGNMNGAAAALFAVFGVKGVLSVEELRDIYINAEFPAPHGTTGICRAFPFLATFLCGPCGPWCCGSFYGVCDVCCC